jgi:uroporphyrin-III C-methyltransferase/precorrin-2 dehydrogenase/sirohydrochlorin ferrochelatase
LYDSLVDGESLRRLTPAQCFCVGKRAGRASVKQETIDRLMIRAARQGKRVVRLKGGDPFVFGRGAEEALALTFAGIPFEVVPGVSTAVAAPELAGIPVTHRGLASSFLVVAGHTPEALDGALRTVTPNGPTVVIMMAIEGRSDVSSVLIAHGWASDTRAAIVCGAATRDSWTWSGCLAELGSATPPEGVAGVIVVGDVVQMRETLLAAERPAEGIDEVKYGRS